jgi:very-short-patch-repair endonuclease
VFAGRDAVARGVSRKQVARLREQGVVERLFADVYRLTAVAASHEQSVRAALVWAGDLAAVTGRSSGVLLGIEDARRRRLTSIPAVEAYLQRFGSRGVRGVRAMRAALRGLDPSHPARSTLEVRTRRLLVQHGITGFVREHPLVWNGRTYRFDFGFPRARVILETNGRRWHDDAADFEHDQEKWSVPGRHGYRLVFATWTKVGDHSDDLVAELRAALAA